MSTRFAATEHLASALEKQKIVAGNQRLAMRIAETGELIHVPRGTTIIHQGAADNEVYLIIEGSFDIVVGGKTLARRVATDHVGEMAAILPVQRRAASVIAHEDSTAVRLTDSQMAELGDEFSQIWRTFAKELAHRVEQRNTVASARNEKVRVFLMGLHGSHEMENYLRQHGVDVHVWKEGAFRGGSYLLENLERMLDQADVAVVVADGDSRETIIFELGFFIGRLGRQRTFLVEPRGDEIKLPHELAGINTITYKDGDLASAARKLSLFAGELGPNR